MSIDDRLLVQVDRAARAAGLSRSAWLAQLAAEALGGEKPQERAERVRRTTGELRRLFADTPPGDSTAIVRQMRDAR